MKSTFRLLIALAVLCSLSSCRDSGGGDDNPGSDPVDNTISRNTCGLIGLGTRIITGTECTETNSPVVEVALGFSDGRSGVCSGTMIASQWVLTAAHCFFENPSSVFVSAGGVSVQGVSAIVHPDVRIDDQNQAVFNDLALIKLANPVNLPTLPLVGSKAPVSGDLIDIYGYGLSEDQSSTNNTVGTLRSGQMRVSEVSANFVDAIYDGEGSNTCSGDSGGPALLDVNGQIGLVAVVSSGSVVNCSKGDTSRFTNIQQSSNFNFITQNVPNVKVL